MSEPWIEKHLSEAEVYERRILLERELDEQDRLSSDIAEFKRAIKNTGTAIERVTDKVRNLRTEIRERRTWVRAPEPQQNLGFADEKPAENKPDRDVSRNGYQLFDELYPIPRTTTELCLLLAVVLGTARYPGNDAIAAWHPDSGIFHGVAHWARKERANDDAEARAKIGEPGIAGLIVPARSEMPDPLHELLNGKPAKKKRARKAK